MCRVNLPGSGLLTWRDLHVGSTLKLYGRTYHLLGCDAFTRSWLQQQGSEQAADSDWPEGPYDTAKKVGIEVLHQQPGKASDCIWHQDLPHARHAV